MLTMSFKTLKRYWKSYSLCYEIGLHEVPLTNENNSWHFWAKLPGFSGNHLYKQEFRAMISEVSNGLKGSRIRHPKVCLFGTRITLRLVLFQTVDTGEGLKTQ